MFMRMDTRMTITGTAMTSRRHSSGPSRPTCPRTRLWRRTLRLSLVMVMLTSMAVMVMIMAAMSTIMGVMVMHTTMVDMDIVMADMVTAMVARPRSRLQKRGRNSAKTSTLR